MPVINVLSTSLRNKIAAGEVVERPASVIKELIENSLDAGGSRIEIEISRAGKKLIKVSDNGSGMDREDAMLAFERYATSKIKDENDLFNIRTMGFRGEALSSIAAVSKVKLITGTNTGAAGTRIEIAGGEIKEIKDCPADGTTIEVKDLFFNTPARRKFLKSDTTENYHIIDTVTRESISNYQTGFFLRMDGDEVMSLPAASSHRERLLQLYGRDFVDGLFETEFQDNRMGIKAFLSKAANTRNNKNNQFLFINKRPFKDQSVTYAVYKAYEDLIPKDKHPLFFILLGIDPDRVDFNVHPTKREVRFEDKSIVFNFVHRAVKTALYPLPPVTDRPLSQANQFTDSDKQAVDTGEAHSIHAAYGKASQETVQTVSEPVASLYSDSIPSLYLGDTFIAIPAGNGISIIDYHAAHERVNYEKFLKKIGIHSYRLLFPQQVKLHGGDYKVILSNLHLLEDFGIEAEDFGHSTIIVRSLPETLRDANIDALMSDVAAALLGKVSGEPADAGSGVDPVDSLRKSIAARLACHSSIRGREVPDGVRIAELMKSLAACENPGFCPHGRPTKITMSISELRKMFRK